MSDNNVQSNQFRDSLSNYAPDTKKSPSEKEKKNVTAFLPKLFILVLCGAVFAYCIYALIDIQKAGKKVVLASGRPEKGVIKVAKELEMDKYGSYHAISLCEYRIE